MYFSIVCRSSVDRQVTELTPDTTLLALGQKI